MTTEPSTDSERLHLWLDPVLAAAVDAHRGKMTRPAFALAAIAKACKLTDYQPRGRGKPRKSDNS